MVSTADPSWVVGMTARGVCCQSDDSAEVKTVPPETHHGHDATVDQDQRYVGPPTLLLCRAGPWVLTGRAP